MFKKIKKLIGYGLLGLGLAYNISCGSLDIERINEPPIIITQTLENAIAGEYYTQKIEAYDKDNEPLTFTLTNAPEGMSLEYKQYLHHYLLEWSPGYSKIGPLYSQSGHFNIKLAVSDGKDTTTKTLDLLVLDNSTNLDYLRTDEDIRFVCETNCPLNEQSLNLTSSGGFNGIKELKKLVQSDTPKNYKPVDVHLTEDSTCLDKYGGNPYIVPPTKTANGKYLICIFKDYDTNGNIIFSPWASGLSDIRDQIAIIHEYIHAIHNNKPNNYFFQESFAKGISAVITDLQGFTPGLNSLCDFRNNSFPLANDLCNMYGFDIQDLPELYGRLSAMTSASTQDAKCIIDDIVKTDSYDAFELARLPAQPGYCGN